MSEFYRAKKYDRAVNEWKAAKFRCYQLTRPDDRKHVERLLAQIGRSGYRAVKAIDQLDLLIGQIETERCVERAANLRKICKELGYPFQQERDFL